MKLPSRYKTFVSKDFYTNQKLLCIDLQKSFGWKISYEYVSGGEIDYKWVGEEELYINPLDYKIVTYQESCIVEKVLEYMKNGSPKLPEVGIYKNTLFIQNGNHRLAAAIILEKNIWVNATILDIE